VEAIFEEWSGANDSQSQRTVKSCVFDSLRTKLWYVDEIGDLYLRGDSAIVSKFHCEKTGCYFNIRPLERAPQIAFKSSEALFDHYHQAHNSPYQTSVFDPGLQASDTQTGHGSFQSMPASVLSLTGILNESSPISTDPQPGQYFRNLSTDQPWSPQRLRWDANVSEESHATDSNYTSHPSFDDLSYLPMDFIPSDKADIERSQSDTSQFSDGPREIQFDSIMTSYPSSPTPKFSALSSYSETDDRASVCSGRIPSAPESVVSLFSGRSTLSVATSRQD
jgi:hypothetical protein